MDRFVIRSPSVTSVSAKSNVGSKSSDIVVNSPNSVKSSSSLGSVNVSVSDSEPVVDKSPSVNVNGSRKRKNNSTQAETPKRQKFSDKEYDKNERVRKFQPTWQISFPWVQHVPDADETKPGVMYCTTCRAYPEIADKTSNLVTGCTTMRICGLKKHETSASHMKATDRKKKDAMTTSEWTQKVKNSPIVKAANKSAEINMKIFTVMFNTVYAIAKKGKPMSDYEMHMELHVKNRSDIGTDYMDIGTNYQSEKSAKQFLLSITDQQLAETVSELQSSRFLTVLADGSTDYSMTEQYAVLVRFVKNGCPVTKLASMEAVESATAEGVLNGVESGLQKVGVSEGKGPKVVSANFDGAAVMMGCKAGVSTLMKEKNKCIIPVHCVAHKLELGVLDAVKCMDYLSKFEETVKCLYRFYAKSPKRRRELKSIADMLESDLLKYGDVKGVRWVASKGRALKALENNLPATIGHLEHAASLNKLEEGGKAKKLLHEIQSARFVKFLYLMMDYLEAITATSQKFQQKNLLIMDVPQIVRDLTDELELMKDEPGVHTNGFIKNFDMESSELKHGSHILKLSGAKPKPYEEDNDKSRLLSNSIKYLEDRFAEFKDKPLRNFTVFDLKNWPNDDKELLKYGRSEIRELCEHFQEILSEDEQKSMLREWTTLKNQLKMKKCGVNCHTLYCELLQTQSEDITNILVLVNIMITISPSTAECERQFSAMKLIKSARRSHMNQDTLEALMRVHADGPPISTFDPKPAIHHWLSSGPGTRHLNGHKLPKKTIVTVDVSDAEDDSDHNTSRDQ